MYGIERRNVARVWCGVMPRVGSKRHMRFCPDCRAVKRRYWAAVNEQGRFRESPSRDS